MIRTRTTGLVVAAVLLAGAVAGCSSKAPDAVTVSGAAPAATISDTSAPEPADSPSSAPPAQVTPLTKAQLKAALPPASAIKPKGWKVAKSSTNPTESKDKITPASCQQVYASLEPAVGKEVASAERNYQASQLGPFLSVSNASYSEVPPAGVFDGLAAAVSKCPKFTSTNRKGVRTTFTAAPLKFPNVGDQTFAIRLVGTQKSGGFTFRFTADVAIATKGAASVSVANIGLGKLVYPPATLTTLKTALSRLPS